VDGIAVMSASSIFGRERRLRAERAGCERKHWAAQWITAPAWLSATSVVLRFRKVVELERAVAHFVVNVSADNQFILYVNGKEAGRGPSRADQGHWRYETYDIAALLHTGRNTLAATVWHFGTRAAIAQMSERTGFLLRGMGDRERAADTNTTWEVEEEKGIETLRPLVKDTTRRSPENGLTERSSIGTGAVVAIPPIQEERRKERGRSGDARTRGANATSRMRRTTAACGGSTSGDGNDRG